MRPTSDARALAASLNGAKGGRPKGSATKYRSAELSADLEVIFTSSRARVLASFVVMRERTANVREHLEKIYGGPWVEQDGLLSEIRGRA